MLMVWFAKNVLFDAYIHLNLCGKIVLFPFFLLFLAALFPSGIAEALFVDPLIIAFKVFGKKEK